MKVSVDTRQFSEVKAALLGIKGGYEKVVSRAMNKTLSGVKTDASAEIRKELNVKAAIVAKELSVRTSTYKYLNGHLVDVSKPLGLIHFGARATQKGVSVQVRKASSRVLLKHAFIHGKYKGAEQVYWRKTVFGLPRKPGMAYGALPKKPYRLPIEKLTGPRVADFFSKDAVMNPVMGKAGDRLGKNLAHETEFLLGSL